MDAIRADVAAIRAETARVTEAIEAKLQSLPPSSSPAAAESRSLSSAASAAVKRAEAADKPS